MAQILKLACSRLLALPIYSIRRLHHQAIPVQSVEYNSISRTPDLPGALPEPDRPLRTRAELGDEFTEEEWASAIVHGRGIHQPFYHNKTHAIPVASIQFRSHHPRYLDLFTHFASHAASSLGIPISKVAMLPTQRTLWTVIKGPFAHKKTQENFERKVHKRAIKAYDADPEVVDRWTKYLRRHALGGVGMRITKWNRAPISVGASMLKEVQEQMSLHSVTTSEKVKALGNKIIREEIVVTEDSTSLEPLRTLSS